MKFLDLSKLLTIQDILILNFDELGYSDTEIATMLNISRQTIHNCKKRLLPFTEALQQAANPLMEYGDKDINIIVNAFAVAFGNTKTTKYDRWAANRLAKKYEASKIAEVIDALSRLQSDKYAPTVRSVAQFEEKLPTIMSYFKKLQTDKTVEL